MHGINEIRKFDVVITDLPVYKEWHRIHHAEFVKKFNDYHMSLMQNPKDAKQILHAARVIEVLKELDVNKLRDLMKKVSLVTRVVSPNSKIRNPWKNC
jgi:hypothetical protein